MKPKRSLASVIFELATVLLVTAAAFAWGRSAAMAEWGRETLGGEHLLLLLPIMYYIGKRVLLDWIEDLRKPGKDGDVR